MAKTVEGKKQSSIKECMDLACDIRLELGQAIDVLEMLADHAGIKNIPDDLICFMSTPAMLIKALKGTLEKCDNLINKC